MCLSDAMLNVVKVACSSIEGVCVHISLSIYLSNMKMKIVYRFNISTSHYEIRRCFNQLQLLVDDKFADKLNRSCRTANASSKTLNSSQVTFRFILGAVYKSETLRVKRVIWLRLGSRGSRSAYRKDLS